MSFQIHALSAQEFAPLFGLSDAQLSKRKACRMTVKTAPGTPCRVSMADAEVGEKVILVNYLHQPAASPFRASHAIFVRQGVTQAMLQVGEVPQVLASRLISLRGFDASHMMIEAETVEGSNLDRAILAAFANSDVDYIHLHYAKPGCFAASVSRAEEGRARENQPFG